MTQRTRATLLSDQATNLASASNITALKLRGETGDLADSSYILSTDTIDTILPTQTSKGTTLLTTNGTNAGWTSFKFSIGTSTPSAPATGDLWIDTN